MILTCAECKGNGCEVCNYLGWIRPPSQTGIITEIEVPGEEKTFPLTADECKLLYDELLHHTFNQHHPMYMYAAPLVSRMKQFVVDNSDKLRLCKNG